MTSLYMLVFIFIAELGIFLLKSKYTLFLLAVIDLVVGFILMGLKTPIEIFSASVPYAFQYYLGVVLMIKSVYSIVLGMR